MKLNYLSTPTANIADIGKVGSSSLSYAILQSFHPEKKIVWEGADPANTPNHLGRNRIPRTETPELTVLVPVRDAVERFRSACSQSRIEDVDALLTKLETGGVLRNDNKAIESFHFRPQSDYLYPDSTVKLYRFPEDLDALGTEAGLPVPLPVINDGDSQNPPKPNLTAEQITRLEAIYADDIALRDSIATAGQELIVPPAPPAPPEPPEPVYVPREVTNYQVKQALNVNPADRIAVDAFVANSGDQDVIDGWAYAHSFKKNHPLFLGAVAYLGWSQQKVDDLLILAATFD